MSRHCPNLFSDVYVGYTNTHRALIEREAIGTHGGTYAEELIASIVRARVAKESEDGVQIHQNHWDKTTQREADICAILNKQILVVIEVSAKSALTKEEWRKLGKSKRIIRSLIAPRATGLSRFAPMVWTNPLKRM